MSEWWHNVHFLRPWWLLALLVLPFGVWLGLRRDGARAALSRLVDAALLPHLLRGRAAPRGVPVSLFALGWTLCALAMAGPSWNRIAQPLYAQRAAQVVAISLSRHMLARDIAPSRLDRALYKARALLKSNGEGLNALIGYAGDAFVVAPLTTDARSLDDLLEAMAPDTMPLDGDNAAAAIGQGVALIGNAKTGGGSIVLITDNADAQAIAAARKARADGISVSVLGVGTPQGGSVPQKDADAEVSDGDTGNAGGSLPRDAQGQQVLARRDDTALAALAAAGGGRYVAMSSGADDIATLRGELHVAATPTLAAGMTGDQWQDRGPWLLLPVVLIAALIFRRGWLLLLPLIGLPLWPGRAQAASWGDWWLRPDQQAAQALRAGDAAKAQRVARDPAWRGAAAYRAGDYPTAANAMAQANGSEAPYNLGNALARQGQYAPAIEAYDRALKRDPHNADAKANRDAVEAMLRKQRQDQNSPKNDSSHGEGNQGKGGEPSHDSKNQSQQSPQQASAQPNKPDQSAEDQSGKEASGKETPQGQAGKEASPDQAHGADGQTQSPPQTAAQQAAERARAEQARQALHKQMEQTLKDQPANAHNPRGESVPPHDLGTVGADDPESKLPADVRQTLQRVPDDPGALLRRKFELEYRQRQGGEPPPQDEP